ncbi:SIMPL domain-containing protein [Methylopila sp. M107]|uniref:SIMPL domain-containing protein n=1 Tax=Methylopila sp. M107 TaxID=1101190 RepID=UPI00039F7C59|nr:SIMPL domain-containing protein [Methylopila sp. M107]
MLFGKSALSACAAAMLFAGSAAAQQTPPPSIVIVGEGVVSAPPDIALVTSGVVTRASTAGAALKANSAAMAKVLAAVKAAGVEDRDVGTSDLAVQPTYESPGTFSSDRAAKLTGYEVRNMVSIRSRAIDKFGELIDSIVQSGANQVESLGFDVSDRNSRLDEARKSAVADARRKAELYAAASGAKLGALLSLDEAESGADGPSRQFATRSKSAGYEMATPIARGEQELRVRVTARWALI